MDQRKVESPGQFTGEGALAGARAADDEDAAHRVTVALAFRRATALRVRRPVSAGSGPALRVRRPVSAGSGPALRVRRPVRR
ncbi:hypothetical protein TPA0908_12840 [Micromonospora sp. AKA38]|nr:hypothetical protein TPA0908_12840 [Micromonospora sp. AKA38]